MTLLGQIVDRYGKDIPDGPNLAGLLRTVHDVEGIERIRFLTSHPNYFGNELIETIAGLPKVMPHIELPIQAGDDTVLENMKCGYNQRDYRNIVARSARPSPIAQSPPISSWAFPARPRARVRCKPISFWRT